MSTCRQIDDIVKMKRNKMKKIVALVAVLFSVIVPVQSYATDAKSLVIIDSYFDSRVTGATVVCIALDSCKTNPTTIPSSLSDNINHGDAMADVAKKQNPSIGLTLLRSANSSNSTVQDMNGADLIRALTWVNSNSTNVGAVSFSRSISNNSKVGDCKMPTTGLTGTAFQTPDAASAEIVRLIGLLNSKGIPFFASTGNTSNKYVIFPGCLPITNSVTTLTQLFDANTDFSAIIKDGSVSNYNGVIFPLIPQTSSSATVAVAATWVSGKTLTLKSKGYVTVLP
jgi:hypothetical protein